MALVRDDVIVTEGWLDHLTAHFDADEQVAMVGPRLPVPTGPQRTKAQYRSTKKELQKFARRLHLREEGKSEEVDYLDAACVLIRTDVLSALGGFDGGFQTPAFLEDFARRLRQQAMKAMCAADTFVHCGSTDEPTEALEAERRAVERLETGDRHRAAGEPEPAIACYRAALDAKPDYLEVALVLSAALLEEDRPEEAAALFEGLVEIHPDSARLKNYLGRCLYRSKRLSEARTCFEESIALDPDSAETRSNLGVLLWEAGELDAALEQLNRAAELSPSDPDVVFNVAMVYAQLGQAVEAMNMLRHYVASRPEDLNARVHLAVLLLENEAEADGLSELEAVLEAEPDHEEALKVVSRLRDAIDGEEEMDGGGQDPSEQA